MLRMGLTLKLHLPLFSNPRFHVHCVCAISVLGIFSCAVCCGSDSADKSCFHQMANVHPWFANVSIDESAAWTNTFFQEQDVAAADGVSDKPTMYIAETGWPTVRILVLFGA